MHPWTLLSTHLSPHLLTSCVCRCMADPPPSPGGPYDGPVTEYPYKLQGSTIACSADLYCDPYSEMAPPTGYHRFCGEVAPICFDAIDLEWDVRWDWHRSYPGRYLENHYFIRVTGWRLGRGQGAIEYEHGRYGELCRPVRTVRYRLRSGAVAECWRQSAAGGEWVSPAEWGDGGPGNVLVRLMRHLPRRHAHVYRRTSSPPDSRRQKRLRHTQKEQEWHWE